MQAWPPRTGKCDRSEESDQYTSEGLADGSEGLAKGALMAWAIPKSKTWGLGGWAGPGLVHKSGQTRQLTLGLPRLYSSKDPVIVRELSPSFQISSVQWDLTLGLKP